MHSLHSFHTSTDASYRFAQTALLYIGEQLGQTDKKHRTRCAMRIPPYFFNQKNKNFSLRCANIFLVCCENSIESWLGIQLSKSGTGLVLPISHPHTEHLSQRLMHPSHNKVFETKQSLLHSSLTVPLGPYG